LKKYSVIVADCCWAPKDGLKMSSVKRGAEANYSVMSTDELCNLPVQRLADPKGCVLALWVLGSMLEDGMKVMKAWGFEQKQVYVWNKIKKQENLSKELANHNLNVGEWILSFGMGRLFRQSHEICLIGINNTGIYKKIKNKSQRSVSFATNLKHSQKPEHLQDSLDLMFSGKKIELFARRVRNGWDCLGNEIDGKDIRDAITTFIPKKSVASE
jgi:N6-adenosine-specific RNA methylase IME4